MRNDWHVLYDFPPDPGVDTRRDDSAATEPRCDYCGLLGWTVEKYGRVTHKQGCPHRTDPWHQGDPDPAPSDGCAAKGDGEAWEAYAHRSHRIVTNRLPLSSWTR